MISLADIWKWPVLFAQFSQPPTSGQFWTFLLCVLFTGCNGKICKVDPPPSVFGTNKEIAATVAANVLGSGISGVEAGGSYKNIVNRTYVAVGQDDVAFYLLLQAANCESARGHLAQADALIKAARQELARRNKAPPAVVASHPDSLTPTEKRVLAKSPLKEEIKTSIAAPDSAPSPAPKKKTSRKPKAKSGSGLL